MPRKVESKIMKMLMMIYTIAGLRFTKPQPQL